MKSAIRKVGLIMATLVLMMTYVETMVPGASFLHEGHGLNIATMEMAQKNLS